MTVRGLLDLLVDGIGFIGDRFRILAPVPVRNATGRDGTPRRRRATRRVTHRLRRSLVFSGVLVSLAGGAAWAVPAFPTAEGYGANAQGGRGGVLIYVDNLNDESAPWPQCQSEPDGCSLRSALLATVPRTVLFRVGGTIELLSRIDLRSQHSYLTLAGQTAPGDGIQIKNFGIQLASGVHDVIIRYIRFRTGMAMMVPDEYDRYDSLEIRDARDVIVDHCSIQWGPDETLSVWQDARDITVQWSIIAEPPVVHAFPGFPSGPSLGMLAGGQPGGPSITLSIHHNLIAHVEARAPRISQGNRIDIRNNTVYNWTDREGLLLGMYQSRHDHQHIPNIGSPQVNLVGNTYKRGPASSATIGILGGLRTEIFNEGNSTPNCPGTCPDPWGANFIENNPAMNLVTTGAYGVRPLQTCSGTCVPADCRDCFPAGDGVCQGGPNFSCSGGTCNGGPFDGKTCSSSSHCRDNGRGCEIRGETLAEKYGADDEFSVPGVLTTSAIEASVAVLGMAGAIYPIRDELDFRIVNEVSNGTGAVGCGATGIACIDPGHWPTLRNGTPSPDTDLDGLPDAWEQSRGLNPNNAQDANADSNGDGYTNLEDFLNGIVAFDGDPPASVTSLERDNSAEAQ